LAVLSLLLSICLIFAIFAPWTMGQTFSTLSPPDPTPPTGAPVDGDTSSSLGPPIAAPTPATPEVTTAYPIY
ncbi:hypothetical protein KR067_013318, partial [Drosophila pandora]